MNPDWKLWYKQPSDPMWRCIAPLTRAEKDLKVSQLQAKGYEVKPEYCGPVAPWFHKKVGAR